MLCALEAIGRKLDLHLGFADAWQIDARDARNALERTLDFAIEQIVGVRERLAAFGRDAQLQDRLVRRREFLHGVALQVNFHARIRHARPRWIRDRPDDCAGARRLGGKRWCAEEYQQCGERKEQSFGHPNGAACPRTGMSAE